MADAAFEILGRKPSEYSGNTAIDDDILAQAGITDLSAYAAEGHDLMLDIFVDDWGALARP